MKNIEEQWEDDIKHFENLGFEYTKLDKEKWYRAEIKKWKTYTMGAIIYSIACLIFLVATVIAMLAMADTIC